MQRITKTCERNKTFKNTSQVDLQDGGGGRREITFLHKYIKNTSTCRTTPTEHILNAGRKPQTSQKARKSPHTWVGQKEKEKIRETKELGWDLCLWEGDVKEEMFPYTGKSPHWQGQRGSLRVSEENAAAGVQRAKWRETCTQGQCQLALPSLR